MTDDELRVWAEAHPNMPQAVAVLRLLDEVARVPAGLRVALATGGGIPGPAPADPAPEAPPPFDGATPMLSTVAGRRTPPPPGGQG